MVPSDVNVNRQVRLNQLKLFRGWDHFGSFVITFILSGVG